MRQIVLDTETTGLDPALGHKIIEIGCVELVNRRLTGNHYHQYINPMRDIDAAAVEVHGITTDFLADKPTFDAIADDFIRYIDGAELIIHNAPFDIGFIDSELRHMRHSVSKTATICSVIDSLVMARKMHPGRRNTLDALCDRYDVDNSQRDLHGALLDAEILADVYLMMTSGQTDLGLGQSGAGDEDFSLRRAVRSDRPAMQVVKVSEEELSAHTAWVEANQAKTQACVWHADGGATETD